MPFYVKKGVKIYSWDNCPHMDFIKDLQKIAWWNEEEIAIYTEEELMKKYKKEKNVQHEYE